MIAALRVVEASPGDFVCKIGRQANYWFGVLDGLLKMSNDSSLGFAITFTGVPPGAWFGEGTVLKREVYRYNIEPLRRSVVAGIDIDTFFWLLERSIPFNRYVMNQLNERLGQFIAAREIDRLNDPDTRVARSLAALFHPVLYPGVGTLLRITQQELGYLGRPRASASTRRCAAAGRGADRHRVRRVRVWIWSSCGGTCIAPRELCFIQPACGLRRGTGRRRCGISTCRDFRRGRRWGHGRSAHHRQPRRVRRRAARPCTSGHVLVHASESWGGCSIDGGVVGSAFRTLADYALIDEFHNPEGFEHIRYLAGSTAAATSSPRARCRTGSGARCSSAEEITARLLG